MTAPDPIDAAALAMHAADCGCRDYGVDDAEDQHYRRMARAAAPILIAAGRAEAAKAIEEAGKTYGCDFVHMDWAAEAYAAIARGGTP